MAGDLTFPWQRDEIRDLVAVVLADAEERRNYPHGLGEWVEDLNDLTSDGARGAVGIALRTPAEADAVQSFIDRRDSMIDSCDEFDALEQHPLWPQLQGEARAVVAALAPPAA